MIKIINKQLPLPLYHQIKEDIINKIKSKEYLYDEKIPSENELKKRYNVSSITIKKALSDLVNEGYLYRIQGKGTFVAKPKISRFLNLMSFTNELRERGLEPTTRLIDISTINNEFIAGILGLSLNDLIVKVSRLRLADNEPMAIQTSYIPQKLIASLKMEKFKNMTSLYDLLGDVGIVPFKASEEYSIKILTEKDIYTLLNQKKGSPAFLVKRITYTEDNLPFEYAESILKGDRYSIKVNLINK
ncbi:GntR family transcriptional regulator [Thermoanaerobacterium thermosaccharolyticum]|uniref:GntR family transcriptional regulator n=1 Tax=Thermoanaerobacterium thermosaccharolyticum TaxID=1517 RepID=UPI003D2DBC82